LRGRSRPSGVKVERLVLPGARGRLSVAPLGQLLEAWLERLPERVVQYGTDRRPRARLARLIVPWISTRVAN
jgi:hypothetical protein